MGLTASNRELNYNWKRLMQVAKRLNLEIDDKFHNKDYKFLTNPEKCFLEF
jgi:hypothetical protein